MPGHSCCSYMLINIFFSLLLIPWWLEDSAATRSASLCQLSFSPKWANWWFGEGDEPSAELRESLLGPWRAFVASVTKSSVKTIECEYVLCCALYVSFHADLRKDGLSYCHALQKHHRGLDM